MSDRHESVVVNGQRFRVGIRRVGDGDEQRWFTSIGVDGREHLEGGSWWIGPCASEGELRHRIDESIARYLNRDRDADG